MRKNKLGIVGGGLGGLSLAIQAARKGFEVTLFEKNTYPFHRVCGEYISLESYDFIERLGVPLTEWNLPMIKRLEISSPKGTTVSESLPLGGFGLSRFQLDDELARVARSLGVLILEKHTVSKIDYLTDTDLYILKTDAYLALDQQEKAVTLLEEALSLFEGEERIELLFELADVYDDYEDFDKVFDCLKLILEDDPNNEEALYKICFWTDFTGRNEEGIRLHQSIIDEYPYNELAWFNLAAAYQGLKLYEKAIDAYKYAITIEEKFDYAYRNMGDAYIRLRKYKEAIEALEKVNELAKPEDVIFEAIGYCYERMKNHAQARFYYRKATHLRQDDSKLFYKIACTYYNEGNWAACIKQLETALKLHRLQPEYNLLAGECKIQLGLFRAAIQYFTNAVRLRPKNPGGWEALIRCLYKAGFYEEALEQTQAGQLVGHAYKMQWSDT